MTLLSLAFSLLLSLPIAQAEPPQGALSSPDEAEITEVGVAVQELRSAREELARAREALQARDQEVESLRAQVQRLEDRGGPNLAGERVSFGQPLIVHEDERVGDVVAFGNDVHVRGEVSGNATAFGGAVNVAEGGRIRGDAVAFGGRIEVADGAEIDGDRIAIGAPGLQRLRGSADGSEALGSVGDLAEPALLSSLYRRLVALLAFAGAGLLVIGIFPRRIHRIADTLEARPARSLLVGGLASSFLLLFGLLFAIATFGLGLPVSLLALGVLGLAWMLGFVGFCQVIGDRLPVESRPAGRWLPFLLGAVLVAILGSLPVIGWLLVAGASVAGIGAALSTRLGRR